MLPGGFDLDDLAEVVPNVGTAGLQSQELALQLYESGARGLKISFKEPGA